MCDVQFLSSVNGILCYSGQKKLFFFVFFFYPEHQIHQQSLWILLPQYLINLPTSFTKITVVYITIIFIWTTEIAIKLIFLHIFSLSSNQFFLQCSYWTFQMANLVTLYSCKKSVSGFHYSQNKDKIISHVLQRSTGFGLFIQYYLAADSSKIYKYSSDLSHKLPDTYLSA